MIPFGAAHSNLIYMAYIIMGVPPSHPEVNSLCPWLNFPGSALPVLTLTFSNIPGNQGPLELPSVCPRWRYVCAAWIVAAYEKFLGNSFFPFTCISLALTKIITAVLCHILVYTTQVNSVFRTIWLVPHSWNIKSAIHLLAPSGEKKGTRTSILSESKITIWQLCCINIILKQLFVSVNSGGCLPRWSGSVNIHRNSPPLWWIIIVLTIICQSGNIFKIFKNSLLLDEEVETTVI